MGGVEPSGVEKQDGFFLSLSDELAAKYDIGLPEEAQSTVFRRSTKPFLRETGYKGLMIAAGLADAADDGSGFDACMLKDRLGHRLPVRTAGEYEGPSAWYDIVDNESMRALISAPDVQGAE